MAVEDSVAQDQLRAFIERIERMEQEALLELYMSALGMVAAPPED